MSPARKSTAKGARKSTKKAARKATGKKASGAGGKTKAAAKPAKKTGAGKSRRKVSRKTASKSAARAADARTPRKAAEKTAGGKAERAAETQPASPPESARDRKGTAPTPDAGSASPQEAQAKTKRGTARPVGSAEKTPRLGAKWACFHCGAKFYDLNRPDPICPKCSTDQRDQPEKVVPVAQPPAKKRPVTAPISRLLDEEEGPEPPFDEDGDVEGAAELDIGKLEGDVDYLDDAEFGEDADE